MSAKPDRKMPGVEPEEAPIQTNGRELRDVSADVVEALEDKNEPPVLFMRSRSVVRMCRDEKGHPYIGPVGLDEMVGHMSRAANFAQAQKAGFKTIYPARDVARDILVQTPLPFPPLGA